MQFPDHVERDLRGEYHALKGTPDGRTILEARRRAGGKKPSRDLDRRAFTERPFVAWDGEGANDHTGRHQYILYGSSHGTHIEGPSLGTAEILTLMHNTEREQPNAIHVIFAGKYDINMLLKDCHWMVINRLHTTGRAQWGGYKLSYASGKFFRVTRDGVTMTLFDVWAFFGVSFVKACREYLGVSGELDYVESMKEQRNSFSFDDLSEIKVYWHTELRYLIDLCHKLRDNLLAANINLTSWHGPGAIASVLMRKNDIHSHMKPTPPEVLPFVQHAYAGGRSELFCGGVYYGKVYQYDLNQAYPAAITRLPSLAQSSWQHSIHKEERLGASDICDFSIYRVSARTPMQPRRDAQPYPLFWRDRHGGVYFPKDIEGWYWGPEIRLLTRDGGYNNITIRESWHLNTGTERPFHYLNDMARQRREWKTAGNPAHIAYKLGMNSMFGKTAQRVGAYHDGPPAWHQLEWAGLICSFSRATLYAALMQKPHAVISCSTDSVFTTEPLDLPCSDMMGDWELKVSDGIIALQSGVYWLLNNTGEWESKYRGFDAGSLTVEQAMSYLRRIDVSRETGTALTADDHLSALSTRFMTWSQTKGSKQWRQWVTAPRTLEFGSPLSKRGHYPRICPECKAGLSLTESLHTFHTSGLPWIGKSMSAAHSLPWNDYGTASQYPYGDEISLHD